MPQYLVSVVRSQFIGWSLLKLEKCLVSLWPGVQRLTFVFISSLVLPVETKGLILLLLVRLRVTLMGKASVFMCRTLMQLTA